MPAITIPSDLAHDVTAALRRSGDTFPACTFRKLVAEGAIWRASRVRLLLAWARRHPVSVTSEYERFLAVVIKGFVGAGWRERMTEAKAVLRTAAQRVASGVEPEDGYVPIWGMCDDEPPRLNVDAMWSWDGRGPHDANPVQQASRGDIAALHALTGGSPSASRPSPPSMPAPASPPAPPPSASARPPRGGWFTR